MSVYDFCALNLSISGYYNCLDLRYVKSPRKLTACLWESQGPRLYHSKFPLYKLCLLNPMFIPLPRPTGSFGNVGKSSSTCSSLIYPLARWSREDALPSLKRPCSILTHARGPRRRGLGVAPEAFYLDIRGIATSEDQVCSPSSGSHLHCVHHRPQRLENPCRRAEDVGARRIRMALRLRSASIDCLS